MKVLISRITDTGVILRSSNLIKALIQLGHEVAVVTPFGSSNEAIIGLGCKYIEIKIQGHGMNPMDDYLVYNEYKKILLVENPNIVLLFTTKPNIYCGIACRKYNIPVIMNITGLGAALGNKGFTQKLMIKLYKMACNGKNIKALFFQNEDSLQFFKKYDIGNSQIFKRIPGSGIDLEKYPVQAFPISDTVDFLFIARIMKQKGIDHYIEAAKVIRKSHPETVFHVLGACDDEYRGFIDKENKNGTIVYHGCVNNVIEFQRISQCTIQPSYYPEGMSNVILEAAACGRPVITTDHPGCREGVEDGVTGYVVPIRDTYALICAIERFLSLTHKERAIMGLRGRKKMELEFDQKKVTNAYIELIRTCS